MWTPGFYRRKFLERWHPQDYLQLDGVDLFPNTRVWIQRAEYRRGARFRLYLYENLERRAAITQTLDPVANLTAQERIRTIATDPRLIVPGQDPAVFQRFAPIAPGIAGIR